MPGIYTDPINDKASVSLYGHRFYADQGPIELLSELLLVFFSEKRIDDQEVPADVCIPMHGDLKGIQGFQYKAKYRLGLKLFALYNNRTGDQEVPVISAKFKEINSVLRSKIDCSGRNTLKEGKAVDILRELYKGFQSVGSNRDWCAQSFLPISKELIAGESIWQNTLSKKHDLTDYDTAVKFFAHDKHDFYARGGEVLFLQLFSALNHSKADVISWLTDKGNPFSNMRLNDKEKDPEYLRNEINKLIPAMYSRMVPDFFSVFAGSRDIPDEYEESYHGYMGPIPEESWTYGFIFAVELVRLLNSSLDVVDMIRMLELECTLHMVRTLLGRSAAALSLDYPLLPIVSPACENITYKLISNESFKYCQRLMKAAMENCSANDKQADKEHGQSGFKLFQKAAKTIGFVLPPKGQNEHFVISKEILVLLVSTTLYPKDDLITYDDFLSEIRTRFGLVVDSDGFTAANTQKNKIQKINDPDIDSWFIQMLEECDYYVRLSDSLSLVKNTNVERPDNEK